MDVLITMTDADRARSIETLIRLDGDIHTKQQAATEARIMLGHVVRSLRKQFSRRDVEAVIAAAKVHVRRVREAVRLAVHFAHPDGTTDWEKIKAKQAERGVANRSGAHSIRSLVNMVRETPPAATAIDESEAVDLVDEPDDGSGDPPPDADEDFDADVDHESVVEEVIDVDDPREEEHRRSLETTGLAAAAAGVIGKGVRGKNWSVGPQMSMAGLYERATDLADDLERALDACGFVNAGDMLRPIRARLSLQSNGAR